MHIVGGKTSSMEILTGVPNSFCSPQAIPFVTIGYNDASSYKTHFFKEQLMFSGMKYLMTEVVAV